MLWETYGSEMYLICSGDSLVLTDSINGDGRATISSGIIQPDTDVRDSSPIASTR